jgi:hypothetical protein
MPAAVEPVQSEEAEVWTAEYAPDTAYPAQSGDYAFVPAPETELPLTPEDIDTGEDVYAFALEMAQAEAEPSAPTKWETRDDLAVVHADYAPEDEELPTESGFDFELPGENGFGDLFASPITPAEMDAIAALYSSLDDAGPAGEPDSAQDPAQEEERG